MIAVYYKCLLVFDMVVIPDVAAVIKQHWDEPVFDNSSQIDQEDDNLHDVSIAFRNMTSIQNLIERRFLQSETDQFQIEIDRRLFSSSYFCVKFWMKLIEESSRQTLSV